MTIHLNAGVGVALTSPVLERATRARDVKLTPKRRPSRRPILNVSTTGNRLLSALSLLLAVVSKLDAFVAGCVSDHDVTT